jgi:hypothetical protein
MGWTPSSVHLTAPSCRLSQITLYDLIFLATLLRTPLTLCATAASAAVLQAGDPFTLVSDNEAVFALEFPFRIAFGDTILEPALATWRYTAPLHDSNILSSPLTLQLGNNTFLTSSTVSYSYYGPAGVSTFPATIYAGLDIQAITVCPGCSFLHYGTILNVRMDSIPVHVRSVTKWILTVRVPHDQGPGTYPLWVEYSLGAVFLTNVTVEPSPHVTGLVPSAVQSGMLLTLNCSTLPPTSDYGVAVMVDGEQAETVTALPTLLVVRVQLTDPRARTNVPVHLILHLGPGSDLVVLLNVSLNVLAYPQIAYVGVEAGEESTQLVLEGEHMLCDGGADLPTILGTDPANIGLPSPTNTSVVSASDAQLRLNLSLPLAPSFQLTFENGCVLRLDLRALLDGQSVVPSTALSASSLFSSQDVSFNGSYTGALPLLSFAGQFSYSSTVAEGAVRYSSSPYQHLFPGLPMPNYGKPRVLDVDGRMTTLPGTWTTRPAPALIHVHPATGPPGTMITLIGHGWSLIEGDVLNVLVDGMLAEVASVTDTTIQAIVPAVTGFAVVTLQLNGQPIASLAGGSFTGDAPSTITSFANVASSACLQGSFSSSLSDYRIALGNSALVAIATNSSDEQLCYAMYSAESLVEYTQEANVTFHGAVVAMTVPTTMDFTSKPLPTAIYQDLGDVRNISVYGYWPPTVIVFCDAPASAVCTRINTSLILVQVAAGPEQLDEVVFRIRFPWLDDTAFAVSADLPSGINMLAEVSVRLPDSQAALHVGDVFQLDYGLAGTNSMLDQQDFVQLGSQVFLPVANGHVPPQYRVAQLTPDLFGELSCVFGLSNRNLLSCGTVTVLQQGQVFAASPLFVSQGQQMVVTGRNLLAGGDWTRVFIGDKPVAVLSANTTTIRLHINSSATRYSGPIVIENQLGRLQSSAVVYWSSHYAIVEDKLPTVGQIRASRLVIAVVYETTLRCCLHQGLCCCFIGYAPHCRHSL